MTLELKRPHGFLLWRGKKTAIARPAGQELPAGQGLQITCDGEGFGAAVLARPVEVTVEEFDEQKWFKDHRVFPNERRAWWPGAKRFLIYPVQEFRPLSKTQWLAGPAPGYKAAGPDEGTCPSCIEYTEGYCRMHDQVVEDDHACSDYQTLEDWRGGEPAGDGSPGAEQKAGLQDGAPVAVKAIETGELPGQEVAGEGIPEADKADPGADKEEAMPYEKRRWGNQWCVFKAGKSEPIKCYNQEKRADAYLAALRINVEAAEKASAVAEKAAELTERASEIAKELGLTDERLVELVRDYLLDRDGKLPVEAKAQVTKSEKDGDHPAGHYLVAEDPESPSTWHLRVRNKDGGLDHRLMGGAWAALHGGYRGNKYQGPDKARAIAKLKKLYEDEGLDLPGEDGGEKAGPSTAQDTKARGEGQGQGNERNPSVKTGGDGGTDTCVCPECGKAFPHGRGTPCNERMCPDCDVPLVGSDGEAEEEEEGEAKAAPIAIAGPDDGGSPASDTKAGQRIKRSMKQRIREAMDTLKEVLGWAEYDDQASPNGEAPEGALASFFKMDDEYPSGMGIKAVGGEPWMFSWTTNAFKDRQQEIFSTAGLEQYVKEAEAKKDRGTYDLWHIKGTDFADVRWQGVIGRFLVEAGPFHDTPIGRAAKAFFTKHPGGHPVYAPEGWGASPEFRYLPEERKSGTYQWIWIVRRAVLPRAAAANVWTRGMEVGTMALSKQQEELGREILGQELLDQVIREAEARSKELEAAGVAHKAHEGDVAEPEEEQEDLEELEIEPATEAEADDEGEDEEKAGTTQVEVDVKAVAEQLAGIFEVKLEPLQEMADQIQALTVDVKALRDELQTLKGQQRVKQMAEMPRMVLTLTKRASEAAETQVQDDDPLQKMKPAEAAPKRVSGAAHFFGD